MDAVDRNADSESDSSSEEEEDDDAGDRASAGRKSHKKSSALRPADRAALLGIGEDSDNEPPATGKVLIYRIGGGWGGGTGRSCNRCTFFSFFLAFCVSFGTRDGIQQHRALFKSFSLKPDY